MARTCATRSSAAACGADHAAPEDPAYEQMGGEDRPGEPVVAGAERTLAGQRQQGVRDQHGRRGVEQADRDGAVPGRRPERPDDVGRGGACAVDARKIASCVSESELRPVAGSDRSTQRAISTVARRPRWAGRRRRGTTRRIGRRSGTFASTANTVSTAGTAGTAGTGNTANTAGTANTANTAGTASTASTAGTAGTAGTTDTANVTLRRAAVSRIRGVVVSVVHRQPFAASATHAALGSGARQTPGQTQVYTISVPCQPL